MDGWRRLYYCSCCFAGEADWRGRRFRVGLNLRPYPNLSCVWFFGLGKRICGSRDLGRAKSAQAVEARQASLTAEGNHQAQDRREVGVAVRLELDHLRGSAVPTVWQAGAPKRDPNSNEPQGSGTCGENKQKKRGLIYVVRH